LFLNLNLIISCNLVKIDIKVLLNKVLFLVILLKILINIKDITWFIIERRILLSNILFFIITISRYDKSIKKNYKN